MQSQTISVSIEQPFDEVYGFLADPLNFPSWAPVTGPEVHHLQTGDWLVHMPSGPRVIRFTEPNLYGVLDFVMFGAGEQPGLPVPTRLARTETGCELLMVWRQGADVPDDRYLEQLDRIAISFRRLKTLLESDPAD